MKKLNYIDVKNNIENFGYKLLSEKYINALTKLEMQCPEGHDFEIKYNNFQQGQRCSICFGTPKKILNEIKEYIESFNYKLLSTEYKDNRTKLELQCSEGHIFKMAYGSFKNQNYRCPECAGNRKFIIEDIKEYIESFDYKLLSTEYVNIFSKLKIQCLKGHIYAVTYNNFKNHNRRCPECSNSKMFSKPEKEIAEYVKENYTGDVVENDRTQIVNYWTGVGLELDVWMPEARKAIEFNGSYWHNNENAKWHDEIKKKQCIQKKIDLLVIQEQDWYNDKVCCLNKINNLVYNTVGI